MQWRGVMPAITTAFDTQLNVDHDFLIRHARWLRANGCSGIVCLGSLGETATLKFEEKIAIVKTFVTRRPKSGAALDSGTSSREPARA